MSRACEVHLRHDEDCRACRALAQAGPSPAEAYGMVAGELYVPGELGYRPPAEVLAELEPAIVEAAQAYAQRAHKRWPPRPSGGFGWVAHIG